MRNCYCPLFPSCFEEHGDGFLCIHVGNMISSTTSSGGYLYPATGHPAGGRANDIDGGEYAAIGQPAVSDNSIIPVPLNSENHFVHLLPYQRAQ
jgi:hypothetical protein